MDLSRVRRWWVHNRRYRAGLWHGRVCRRRASRDERLFVERLRTRGTSRMATILSAIFDRIVWKPTETQRIQAEDQCRACGMRLCTRRAVAVLSMWRSLSISSVSFRPSKKFQRIRFVTYVRIERGRRYWAQTKKMSAKTRNDFKKRLNGCPKRITRFWVWKKEFSCDEYYVTLYFGPIPCGECINRLRRPSIRAERAFEWCHRGLHGL